MSVEVPARIRKLNAAYDVLVRDFLAPLCSGEVAQVGRPIAPGVVSYFGQTQSTSERAEFQIHDGLHRAASEIARVDALPWRSSDFMGMVVAAHNLLFLTDPALERLFARGARPVVLGWIDELLERVRAPSTRGDALARYALTRYFMRIRRRNTTVKNWAYTYRFFGRPVPPNVTALPQIRLVHQEHVDVEVLSIFSDMDESTELALSKRVRDLIARSPLTELAEPNRFAPLQFGDANTRVLADRALRGGLARQVAAAGEWKSARTFGQALSVSEPIQREPRALGVVLRFLVEIQITASLGARNELRLPETLDAASARYAAILPAWFDGAQGEAELQTFDADDRARLERRIQKVHRLVPRELIDAMSSMVYRVRRGGAAAEIRALRRNTR